MKFATSRKRPVEITGGGPPGGGTAVPESQAGGTEGGKPEALSQPVDPGGVGGLWSPPGGHLRWFGGIDWAGFRCLILASCAHPSCIQ